MDRMSESEEYFKRCEVLIRGFMDEVWSMTESGRMTDLDIRIRRSGGMFLREIMGVALGMRGRKGVHGDAVECRCGEAARFKQHRKCRISTILPGKVVEADAAYYHCDGCRRGIFPLLEELGVNECGMTPGLQELVALSGAIEPYEEAAVNLLSKFAGVPVSGSKVQMLAVKEGAAVGEYLGEMGIETGDNGEADEAICVGIDGGMVHVEDRWQEVKLCVIYDEHDRAEVSAGRGKLLARDVVAVRGGPEELASAMDARLSRFDLSHTRAVVLGDGAKWIWNLAEDMFPNRVEILDYYHVVEHLSACATSLFGEGTEQSKGWIDEQAGLILDDKVEVTISALKSLHARYRNESKRKAIDALRCYLENNAYRMRYSIYLQKGYPIGSGAVESAIKYVVQSRMKRPGTRWQPKGADAMLSLRCLYRSTNRWDEYWQHKRISKQAA